MEDEKEMLDTTNETENVETETTEEIQEEVNTETAEQEITEDSEKEVRTFTQEEINKMMEDRVRRERNTLKESKRKRRKGMTFSKKLMSWNIW